MSEDLPEIGLSAGIENLDRFAQDAKKVQQSYQAMAEAEAQVQQASEQQVAATEAAGKAWQATAAQAQVAADAWAEAAQTMTDAQDATGAQADAVEGADEVWGDLFERFGEVKDRAAAVAQGQKDLIAAMEQGSQSATITAQTQKVLQDAYQRIAQQSGPEMVASLQEVEREFIAAGGASWEWAAFMRDAAGEAADSVVGAAEESATAVQRIATLLSLGVMNQVSGTIGQVGDQLVGFAKDTAFTAARIEELDAVLGNLAKQNDLSAEALRDQVAAVKAQGIESSVAYNLVTQFVQANLDLEKASKLARVAQDAAVISMEDSSQALAGILHGITTLQPEVLRYRGILVDLQGDYQRWADENNRTVQSMTGSEKQMVALNSVLAEGETLVGTYESAMGTASKQMRSFNRYIAELKEDFGQSLLPVLTEGVFTAKDLVKQFMALPQPVKAALAATGALTGGLLKGTSAMISFGSQAAMLAFSLKELGLATKALSLSFLGPVGLVAALGVAAVGVVTYLNAQEEAHRDEAAAILKSAESYPEYIDKLEEAGVKGHAFSEALWEVVKAKQAADKEFDSEAYVDAREEFLRLTDSVMMFTEAGGQTTEQLDMMIQKIREGSGALSDEALELLKNRDGMEELAASYGYGTQEQERFAEGVWAVADAEQDLRQMTEWATESVEHWIERAVEAESILSDWKATLDRTTQSFYDQTIAQYEMTQGMYQMMQAALMADPAVEGLVNQLSKLMEEHGGEAGIQWSVQYLADLTRQAEREIQDLRDRARADDERAQERYHDNMEALEESHVERRAAILESVGEVHEDLLEAMAQAEEDYQADRLALAEQYAEAIAESEAEYARDRAELYDDLMQDLADAERDFAQDVLDAQKDLARDIEDIERKLVLKLLDLEEDYYQDREELAEEYGDKIADITEKYAKEAQSIMAKYGPEEPGFDDRREALQDELDDLNRRYSEGLKWDEVRRRREIMGELEDLQKEELAALEERKQAELDELQEWLGEEQAARDEAYAESIEKQIEAAQLQVAERLLQYDRQLSDLEEALQQERDERQRRYAEQLADLEESHRQELAQLARANEERLAALDTQLANEKARLEEAAEQRREALAEQLADEQDAYNKRKQALGDALAEEKQIIGDRLKEATQTVQDEADEQAEALKAAWERINPAVASAIDILRYNVIQPRMHAIAEDVIGEVARMMAALRSLGFVGNSPAPWWMAMGESWSEGLEKGLDLEQILGDQVAAFGKFKVDAEDIMEVGSPSKWAERMGESVSTGFSNKATLTPSIGDFALDAFESEMPSVQGQDMAIHPFLSSMPEIPAQEMAITPYLLDVDGLAAQSRVQAPTPPMMAAGGMGTVDRSRSTTLKVDAHYSQYQSERSLRNDLEMIRIGLRSW